MWIWLDEWQLQVSTVTPGTGLPFQTRDHDDAGDVRMTPPPNIPYAAFV